MTRDSSTHGGVDPRNKWGDSSFSKIITSMIAELSSDLDVPSPTSGIPPSGDSHEDSLGRNGHLYKDGGSRLHHVFGSTHVAPYHKAARRIRG